MASKVENENVHPTTVPKPQHQIRRKPVPNRSNMPCLRTGPPDPPKTPTKEVEHGTAHQPSGQHARFTPMQDKSAAKPPHVNTAKVPGNKPESDYYVLKACASAADELTFLKSSLKALREDYIALETELRQRMDEYVASKEEATYWKERCFALERREHESNTSTSRGLNAQNDRFARSVGGEEKMGEIWRRKGSFVWVRANEEKKRGVDSVSQALVTCGKKLQQRWAGLRLKGKEESARPISAGEDGLFMGVFNKSPMRPNA